MLTINEISNTLIPSFQTNQHDLLISQLQTYAEYKWGVAAHRTMVTKVVGRLKKDKYTNQS